MSLLLVADTVLLLAIVSALQGVFRALDSGPLESWFIDASLVADRDVDIERGLARQNVVICTSIGVGALLGGALASSEGACFGVDPLVLPIAVGLRRAGRRARRRRHAHARGPPGGGLGRREALHRSGPARGAAGRCGSSAASSLLTALVVAELLWGFGMIAFEMFFPPRLAEVSGGVEEAARLLGPSITAAWVLSGVGAACAPWLVRRFGSGVAGCTLRVVQGGTVVAMGLAAGPAGLIVAYLANYWAHGATAPVHYGMVHRAVEAATAPPSCRPTPSRPRSAAP